MASVFNFQSELFCIPIGVAETAARVTMRLSNAIAMQRRTLLCPAAVAAPNNTQTRYNVPISPRGMSAEAGEMSPVPIELLALCCRSYRAGADIEPAQRATLTSLVKRIYDQIRASLRMTRSWRRQRRTWR